MTAHKHHKEMMQYAQDAAETDKPWLRWESRSAFEPEERGCSWVPVLGECRWEGDLEYRRKPRTMTYTVTIPEPLREAPMDGAEYWAADSLCSGYAHHSFWYGSSTDYRKLSQGLLFASREDAIAAAKAMQPFKSEGA